jgi:hypothetical protein
MKTAKTDEQVAREIKQIKSEMPKTYETIVERAKTMGNKAYQLVRRGLRGEPGCFFSRERIRRKGELDRWIEAGCSTGLPNLIPEQLEAEFNVGLDLVFLLEDPVQRDAAKHAIPAT